MSLQKLKEQARQLTMSDRLKLAIITRDTKGFSSSEISVKSAPQLLELLNELT